jgi:hypothetical protein
MSKSKAAKQMNPVATWSNTIPVVIDYGQTLSQMINARRYDRRNIFLTARHFPVIGQGIVICPLVLVQFRSKITSDEAVKHMRHIGLVAAKIEHLLAYGAQHCHHPANVVALGSIWIDHDRDRCVPFLISTRDRVMLGLTRWVGDWSDDWRFLAVKRESWS